jgi:peptide/nickel transport system permease protein
MPTLSSRTRCSLVALGLVVAIAVAGPLVWRVDPDLVHLRGAAQNLAPSAEHPLGTDENARDLLARLLAGGRLSLAFGLLAAAVTSLLGAGVGLMAALARPWLDNACMRVVDVGLAVPRLLVLIVLTAAFGRLPWGWLAVAMGALGWFPLARMVRTRTRELVTGDFATAARALGAPTWRVAARHLLPNVAGTIAASTVLSFAHAITLEAALSFIGQGVEIPQASWGGLISEGRHQLATAPWLTILPAIAIVVTVVAAGALADGVEQGSPWRRSARRA